LVPPLLLNSLAAKKVSTKEIGFAPKTAKRR